MKKNKLKTHQASKKRFKVTRNNKVRHNKQGDNAHLKANKSRDQKANSKGKKSLKSNAQAKKIIKLMGK